MEDLEESINAFLKEVGRTADDACPVDLPTLQLLKNTTRVVSDILEDAIDRMSSITYH